MFPQKRHLFLEGFFFECRLNLFVSFSPARNLFYAIRNTSRKHETNLCLTDAFSYIVLSIQPKKLVFYSNKKKKKNAWKLWKSSIYITLHYIEAKSIHRGVIFHIKHYWIKFKTFWLKDVSNTLFFFIKIYQIFVWKTYRTLCLFFFPKFG